MRLLEGKATWASFLGPGRSAVDRASEKCDLKSACQGFSASEDRSSRSAGTPRPPARGGGGAAAGVCADAETFCDEITPRRQVCAETGRAGVAPLGTVRLLHVYVHIHTALRKIRTWGLWRGWGFLVCFLGLTYLFIYLFYLRCHLCDYLRICATLGGGEGKGRRERVRARCDTARVPLGEGQLR